jgi:TatD DNase family protein
MWIDTHCHLDAGEFSADREAVVVRAREAGVGQIVMPAVDVGNFETVRTLAHEHGYCYALGIHPLAVGGAVEDDLERLREALGDHHADPRLVAVGEIGLDRFVPGPRHRTARALLYRATADGAGLRAACHPALAACGRRLAKLLRRIEVPGGIAHAFNGSRQQADVFLTAAASSASVAR